MKIVGNQVFEAPPELVWQVLLDPEALSKTLPGCERLEPIGENEFRAALNIRVGPVQGQFDGTVRLSDLQPAESYHMVVHGKGPAGFVDGDGRLWLEGQGSQTLVRYEGNAHVGGRIASVGQRLLESSAKALTRQSMDGLNEQVKARQAAQQAGETPPEVEAPSQFEFAAGVARGTIQELMTGERRQIVLSVAAAVLLVLLFWLTRVSGRD